MSISSKSLSPARILPAEEFRDDRLNPLLEAAGIRTEAEFHRAIEESLREIPEVRRLFEVCERHDAIGVLSGSTASMVIGEVVKSIARGEGKFRSFNDLSSDLDVLVMGKDERVLTKVDVRRIADDLNEDNLVILDDTVPSCIRRRVVLEWDVSDSIGFYRQAITHGGDTVSQVGIGLVDGELYVFDPNGGLRDFFHGVLEYQDGENIYQSDFFAAGIYDPCLEGLRLIRMVGRFKEYGLAPSAQTLDKVDELGSDALRKVKVSKALLGIEDDHGDRKLQRRWLKYLNRIWSDAADIGHAITLLNDSHYSQVLQTIGLGADILEPLRERPLTQTYAGAEGTVRGSDIPPQYLWLSRKMFDQFADGKVYGQRGGPEGPGLRCMGSVLGGSGFGSTLTRVTLANDAVFLDLTTEDGRRLERETARDLGLIEVPAADRLPEVLDALGVAGVVSGGVPSNATIRSKDAIAAFREENLSPDRVVDELTSHDLSDVEFSIRVRTLLALEQEAGLERLARAIDTGALSIERFLTSEVIDVLLSAPYRSPRLFDAVRRADAGNARDRDLFPLYRLLATTTDAAVINGGPRNAKSQVH